MHDLLSLCYTTSHKTSPTGLLIVPARARDSKGRKVGDEGYDPTTISISLANGERPTHAMQQYWDVIRENADVLLFFKVGKFYEMFEEDALVSILPSVVASSPTKSIVRIGRTERRFLIETRVKHKKTIFQRGRKSLTSSVFNSKHTTGGFDGIAAHAGRPGDLL